MQRTPGGETVLVAPKVGAVETVLVVEKVVGVEDTVACEFKCAPVETAAACFGHRVHHVTHAPAILRRKGVGLNAEFLEFVNRRNENNTRPVARPVPMAIQ